MSFIMLPGGRERLKQHELSPDSLTHLMQSKLAAWLRWIKELLRIVGMLGVVGMVV